MKKSRRPDPDPGTAFVAAAGLPPKAIPLLRGVARALHSGDLASAERNLALAMVHAPEHPETLLLLGRSQFLRGRWIDAVATLRDAERLAVDSADVLIALGHAQSAASQPDDAVESLRRAFALRPDAATLLELGVVLDANALSDDALAAADRALALDPAQSRARLLRARSLQALGRIDETAAEYRELIRRRQEVPAAWFALLDIKTIRLSDSELQLLKQDSADPRRNSVEQSLLGFALGSACEADAEYPAAVAAFDAANRLVRQRSHWSSPAWTREVDRLLEAALKPLAIDAADPGLGQEVIFIVGMPRSGTTLLEQILGSHSRVEGANELPDLAAVISAETARQRMPFPEWSLKVGHHDWQRLGREYLDRTRRWRQDKPVHTDKMPENWPYVDAIRRMLPAARIIDSRRDPIETAWSCYKQLFAAQRVAYSYEPRELAAYWRDYDRYMMQLAAQHPEHVKVQSHERLLENFENAVRDLLAFCGLAFEAACLQPHRSSRAVRTASAAQVRQPLRQVTTRAERYGSALAPFRAAFDQ